MTTTTTKTPTHKKRRFRRQPYAVDKTAMGLLTAKQTCDAIGITRSALLYVMKMKRLTPVLTEKHCLYFDAKLVDEYIKANYE